MLGEEVSQEEYDRVYHELKLDQPIIKRYFSWLGRAVKGDWGQSTVPQEHIGGVKRANPHHAVLLAERLCAEHSPLNPVRVISAVYRGKTADTGGDVDRQHYGLSPAVLDRTAGDVHIRHEVRMPSYGFTWFSQDLTMGIKQTIMPLFCLALGGIATTTRQTRSSMLEVIRQDYVRTARSKGLSKRKVIFLHALKNALIPVITILGMRLGSMLAAPCSWNRCSISGDGLLFVKAIQSRDIPVGAGLRAGDGVGVRV